MESDDYLQDEASLAASFDSSAKQYDEVTDDFAHAVTDYVDAANLSAFLKEHRFGRILEAGCGTGSWSPFFREHCSSLDGLDISPESIRLAREKNRLSGVNYSVGSIEETSFPGESYDFIAAQGGVISYTPRPERMIREIHRLLKPGGYAWIDFYNALGWAFEHGDSAFKTATARVPERLIRMPDWDYPARVFQPQHLQDMLQHAGFGIAGFFANGVLLNSFTLQEKDGRNVDPDVLRECRDIDLFLSRNAGLWNPSISCQFIVMKMA